MLQWHFDLLLPPSCRSRGQMWCHRHVFCVMLFASDAWKSDLSGLAKSLKIWFDSDFKPPTLRLQRPHSIQAIWFQSGYGRNLIRAASLNVTLALVFAHTPSRYPFFLPPGSPYESVLRPFLHSFLTLSVTRRFTHNSVLPVGSEVQSTRAPLPNYTPYAHYEDSQDVPVIAHLEVFPFIKPSRPL